MPGRAPFITSAFFLASLCLAACTGKTSESGDGGAGDGGGSGSGGGCVDVELSTYDLSCQQDSDCIVISAGQICPGDCDCGGSTINASGQARYQSAVSGIQTGVCGCPLENQPQCLGNVCTICRGIPSDPPACGSTAVDAGADGSVCVNVDLSTYDQSCQSASDCVDITAGTICTGDCTCGGAAINTSGEARYETTLASLGTSTACPCPSSGPIACIQNKCTECGFGPNQPAGCPGGG